MSHNVCYFKSSAVPFSMNTCEGTLALKTLYISTSSGSSALVILYHNHGRYWYTISSDSFIPVSSVAFVSYDNAFQDCKSFIRSNGWIITDSTRKRRVA